MAGVFKARSPDAGRVARAPTRASKAEEEGGKAHKRRNTFVETARGRGAAHESTNESRQGHAAAGARARPHTDWGVERLQEWSRSTSAANEAH